MPKRSIVVRTDFFFLGFYFICVQEISFIIFVVTDSNRNVIMSVSKYVSKIVRDFSDLTKQGRK